MSEEPTKAEWLKYRDKSGTPPESAVVEDAELAELRQECARAATEIEVLRAMDMTATAEAWEATFYAERKKVKAAEPLIAQVRKTVAEWTTGSTPMADLAAALNAHDDALAARSPSRTESGQDD